MPTPDRTHDAAAQSWVAAANAEGCDFPIQNLPFAVFRRTGSSEAWRGGVAIGDQVIDMAALVKNSSKAMVASADEAMAATSNKLLWAAIEACAEPVLNRFFELGPDAWRALRHALFDALLADTPAGQVAALRACLVPQTDIEFTVPARIGDYTDFYTSYFHADNIGRIFSDAAEVVPANFHWMPQAYHGRVSSIGVSGQHVRRPLGQMKAPSASEPSFGPCAMLDYEMELGFYVGTGNPLGEPVPLTEADSHLFGVSLMNDWSARDIQWWEMPPLGPFLAKNLATTLSPWIVTMEALAPYRTAWHREARFPQPLPYLDAAVTRDQGALDIQLETWLESAGRRDAGMGPVKIAATSFRHQHWTIGQMLAHHTIGGCNLRSGDLIGSGTISGPTAMEAAALMELSKAGGKPLLLEGPNGSTEQRSFLEDGDAVIFRACCSRAGAARIGFGECRGEVTPALAAAPSRTA